MVPLTPAKKIQNPNPNWKPGDTLVVPYQTWKDFDLSAMPVDRVYGLLVGSVVPRPIAFVSTCDKNGNGNLAPFSFFNAVSSSPPLVMISVARMPNGSKKDTCRNIEETGEFVVNSAHEWMAEPLHQCSANYPRGVDEMKKVGLTAVASTRIQPSRVAESAIQMECKLYRAIELGEGKAGSVTLFLGEILVMHVADGFLSKDEHIDFAQLHPLARLGGPMYSGVKEYFELGRPKL